MMPSNVSVLAVAQATFEADVQIGDQAGGSFAVQSEVNQKLPSKEESQLL